MIKYKLLVNINNYHSGIGVTDIVCITFLKYILKQFSYIYLKNELEQGKQFKASVKTLRCALSAKFFEALRVEWRKSTPVFCFGARMKKKKH